MFHGLSCRLTFLLLFQEVPHRQGLFLRSIVRCTVDVQNGSVQKTMLAEDRTCRACSGERERERESKQERERGRERDTQVRDRVRGRAHAV